MLRTKLILAALLSTLLSACASVPMAGLQDDQQAKEFKAPAGKGRIYIFRDENFGGAIKVTVTVDGKLIGQSAPMTYFVADVEPGEHIVACQAESSSQVSVKVKKGEIAYVWQEMKMGMWSAGCKVQEVNESRGRTGVSACKRALANF
jgi:hypothetical protein